MALLASTMALPALPLASSLCLVLSLLSLILKVLPHFLLNTGISMACSQHKVWINFEMISAAGSFLFRLLPQSPAACIQLEFHTPLCTLRLLLRLVGCKPSNHTHHDSDCRMCTYIKKMDKHQVDAVIMCWSHLTCIKLWPMQRPLEKQLSDKFWQQRNVLEVLQNFLTLCQCAFAMIMCPQIQSTLGHLSSASNLRKWWKCRGYIERAGNSSRWLCRPT